jgi:hypothetical protein
MKPRKKPLSKTAKAKLEKATIAESEMRTALVLEMLIKGCSKTYIVRFCAEKFKIRLRQTEVYIAKATYEIKETYGEKYKENIIEKQLAQLDDLYVKNYTIEDFRECRNLIESKSKLLGINAAIKTDITTGGEKLNTSKPDLSKLSPAALDELINSFTDDRNDDK